MHDGAIEHMKAYQKTPPTDSASNTSGPKVPTDKNYYKIVREIPSYPAGLTGAHAVHFVIGKGIKPPEGSAGHSCVLIEETGQKTGPLCEESH